MEQKNGSVVRRLVGYERFSGVIAGQALAHLYQTSRLYVNFLSAILQVTQQISSRGKGNSKIRASGNSVRTVASTSRSR